VPRSEHMARPFIVIRRFPYEEPYHLRLVISAGNGSFSGALEYYCNANDLAEVGSRLARFPIMIGDDYVYELGSPRPEDRFAFHLFLHVFTTDLRGACVLQIGMNNNLQAPDNGSCAFSICAEPSTINRLGDLLRTFAELKHMELHWSDVDGALFTDHQPPGHE
jgi:hypothetical protein